MEWARKTSQRNRRLYMCTGWSMRGKSSWFFWDTKMPNKPLPLQQQPLASLFLLSWPSLYRGQFQILPRKLLNLWTNKWTVKFASKTTWTSHYKKGFIVGKISTVNSVWLLNITLVILFSSSLVRFGSICLSRYVSIL